MFGEKSWLEAFADGDGVGKGNICNKIVRLYLFWILLEGKGIIYSGGTTSNFNYWKNVSHIRARTN